MPVATLWRLLLVSCSLLVVLAGVATTPVSAVTIHASLRDTSTRPMSFAWPFSSV